MGEAKPYKACQRRGDAPCRESTQLHQVYWTQNTGLVPKLPALGGVQARTGPQACMGRGRSRPHHVERPRLRKLARGVPL